MKNRTQPLALIMMTQFLVFSLSFPASLQAQQEDQVTESPPVAAQKEQKRSEQYRQSEIAALETYLQSQGIALSKQGIRHYLQQITDSNLDRSVAKKLIVQLGVNDFSQREAAQQALMKLPRIPVRLLREASLSSDRERAVRANLVLKNVLPRQRQNVEKALRAIELLKISGLTKEILMAVPLVETTGEKQAVPGAAAKFVDLTGSTDLLYLARAALLQTVTAEDLLRLGWVIDNEPTLRTVAIHALSAKSLASVDGVRDRLDDLWDHGEPADRLAATEALLLRGERRALGRFVTLLESEDVEVRYRAASRLWDSTGQLFAFDARGSAGKRIEQVAAWRAWVDASGAEADIRTDAVFTRTWGRTLVSDSGSDSVVEYDLAGNETWRVKVRYPIACWGTGTGERVVGCWEPGIPRFLIVYAAGDGPPRELWSLDYKCSARPLRSGDILVWSSSKPIVRKYNLNGRKLWEAEVVWKGKKRSPLYADQLSNGNIRVLFWKTPKPGPQIADTAVEIDERGQVVRELPYDPKVKLLERLPNGNALVRIDEDNHVRGKRIEERDPADKVVWFHRDGGLVMSAQRLPNGDTFVAAAKELGRSAEIKVIRPDGSVGWNKRVDFWPTRAYRY